MPRPVLQSLRGKWDDGRSGGCPRHETWVSNPQYLLVPAAEGTFTITLKCAASPKLDIGFVVLKQDGKDASGRKTSTKVRKTELVFKTKWKTADIATAEVALPPPEAGRGFIVLPCTFEPGFHAAFELSVGSADGTEFSLVLIGDEAPPPPPPPPPPAAESAPSSEPPTGGAAAAAAEPDAPVVPSGSAYAPPDMGATEEGASVAENEVHVKSEGQGLSAKQKRDAAALVQKALAAAAESADGLYSDPDFPPDASSLWLDGQAPGEALQQAGVGADLVAGWARPSAFPAPDGGGGGGGAPRLFHTEWGVQGVVASPLLNHWLLAACNIVGGDVEILERVFVDTTHADKGFYAVRFFVDDPASDDDWVVVLVDDLLPVGADGAPCFGRCPTARVLWVPIIEKAFAKYKGCYEATSGGSVEDGLLYLTGGMAREVGVTPSADPSLVDALWAQMMEWWMSAHVIGCEHRTDAPPTAELLATGLLPNTPYCVVTGGEPAGAGRMVRLRTFHGYSEWKGKWCDTDPAWTSRLRQSLAYANDGDDGTFWMAFDDFVTWFNVLFTCRMADDRWTTLTIKSRWEDGTAGGAPPNFSTWRCNPMWLLRTTSELRVTVTLSIPQPPPPAGGANVPLFAPESAISLSVITCNGGADTRRRKLQIVAPEELVVRAEPRPVRRLVRHLTLPGSEAPYLLVPHTYMPGVESPFTMTVRADDVDDDGNADFTLEPIRPETDWHTASKKFSWAEDVAVCKTADGGGGDDDDDDDGTGAGGAGGAPGSSGFKHNPQISLHVEKSGRFYIAVDQIGLTTDGRLAAGGADDGTGGYPSVGVAVVANPAAFEDGVVGPEELLVHKGAVSDDSVLLSCELQASDTPYIVVPYLQDHEGSLNRHPLLGCRVWVYADSPFRLSDAEQAAATVQHGLTSEGKCICWGLGNYPTKQNEGTCIVLKVYNSLKRMEQGLDRQLKYLDGLAPHETPDYM